MKKNINNIFLFILPFFIIGIYIGVTTIPLCIGLIALRLFTSSRETSGFFLMLFGGTLGGIIRTAYPSIPIYGIMLELIGICLIYSDCKKNIKLQSAGFKYLLLVLSLFVFTYFYGPHTEYANNKILGILKAGLLLYMAYCVFDRSKRIEEEHIVQLLIISSVMLIIFISSFYHFNIGGLFDYEWFRSSCVSWSHQNKEHILAGGYQGVGMNAAYACVLYLSIKKIDKNKSIFYIILSTQIILTSGCRQALLAILMVVFIRLYYFSSKNNSKKKNMV